MWFLSQRSWLVGAALLATGAQAAGYEKVVTWSGKYVGIGGAAASSVQGSESLYFNPAGLASGSDKKWDASLNFSPTFAKFSGPVIKNDDVKQGAWQTLPIFGATLAYSLNPEWTLATGFFVAGGARAQYEGVNPADVMPSSYDSMGGQTVKTDLKILEYALGASYKLNSQWSFGASWRPTFVRAAFSTFSPHPLVNAQAAQNAAVYLNLKDLSATRLNGFRLGAQYRAEDNKWGAGIAIRTGLSFEAKGKADGKIESSVAAAGASQNITEFDATVKNSFPVQVSLGGDYASGEEWRFFGEYTWTQYSQNKSIDMTGTWTNPLNASSNSLADSPISQKWSDQHNIRLASQYTGVENWPLRFAYVFTSRVVPKDTALASFPAPGIGNTFVFGTGHAVGSVDLNGALEYSFESATVASGEGVSGAYNVKAWGLHLGASMKF